MWFLTRTCSEYNSPELNLGIFDSESKAIAAKDQYIEYYQTHPDPLHDQCYHKVDLNKDLKISWDDEILNEPEVLQEGTIIYMILNSCEGFGQVYHDRMGVYLSLDEVHENRLSIWKDNHERCLIDENGNPSDHHQVDEDGDEKCYGYIARIFLSVFILNQLRYNNQSMYYEHYHKESVAEVQKLLEKEFELEVEQKFEKSIRLEERYQDWVTESASCSSPSELKDISHMKVDLPSNWPGLAQLKELQPLMTECASKISAVYPLALEQLQKDLVVPKHLVGAYEYMIAQLF